MGLPDLDGDIEQVLLMWMDRRKVPADFRRALNRFIEQARETGGFIFCIEQ